MSKERHNLERLLQAAYDFQRRCKASEMRTSMAKSSEEKKNIYSRLFEFIDQPLVLGALFLIGGIVGALIFTPAFIVCALCILVGFHRAKVVSGSSLLLQIVTYLILVVILSASGYFLYGWLDAALDRVQTGLAKRVARLVVEQKSSEKSEPKLGPEQPKKSKPEAPKLPPESLSGGLEFHEVPRSKLGYSKQTIPETFTVICGGNHSTFPTDRLNQQIPFDRLLGVKISGEFPLKVYFDKQGNIKIDATIYQSKDKVGAVIRRSNFSVLNVAWDRNWDATGFEIVDDRRVPIFQIERVQWSEIQIRGILMSSTGMVWVANETRLEINPTEPLVPPARLFEYPGKSHLHQRTGH